MSRARVTPARRPPPLRAWCGCEIAKGCALVWVKRCEYHLAVYRVQERMWRRDTAWMRYRSHG